MGAITEPESRSKNFGEVEMIFAVSKNHPLAQDLDTVTDEVIEQHPVIIIPDSTQMLTPLTVGWTRSSRVIAVSNMEEKIAAQKSGLGVGYLPFHRIEQELKSGELVALNMMETHKDKLVMAWRKGNTGPALQWFLDNFTPTDLGLPANPA
ncbi:MAG: LysR substrate-binding domain-containing protein [Reinekea sp.]